MSDERAFLDRLLADPADDTTRLVYADWLDEIGTPETGARAEFLRLEAEVYKAPHRRRKAIQVRLGELAASLDTDWLAVVSKLEIENCPAGGTAVRRRPLQTIEFDYECPKQWEHLRSTTDDAIRFCEACKQNVYYCDTITAARDHAGSGHCVAVDAGLPRKERDLVPRLLRKGKLSIASLREERERLKLDPVSEARERRKQKTESET
jgi:uncharacterized protein (TIGR02996 family)